MDRKRNKNEAITPFPVERLALKGDWIESFVSYTSGLSSPALFCKWAAIWTVAAALERKVWVHTRGSALYPNLYVFLVAPPGVGKTEVTWRTRDMLDNLEDFHLSPNNITRASLIDTLAEANRRVMVPTNHSPVTHFNSLAICTNELGVLLPGYEAELMNTLQDLYDCKSYTEAKRGKDLRINIENPQIGLLGACTPSYLTGLLPEGAWEQGLTSRTILIFAGTQKRMSLFMEEDEGLMEKRAELLDELEIIHGLYGKIKFTREAAEYIDQWQLSGGEPVPQHPKLLHYATRRTAHALKLAIVASCSARADMIIRLEDIERALSWLFEAELHMPDIFKAMASQGAGKSMDDAWYFLFTLYSKEQEPIAEYRLINYLKDHIPVHEISKMIELMEKGKLIEQRLTPHGKAWIPKAKMKTY